MAYSILLLLRPSALTTGSAFLLLKNQSASRIDTTSATAPDIISIACNR